MALFNYQFVEYLAKELNIEEKKIESVLGHFMVPKGKNIAVKNVNEQKVEKKEENTKKPLKLESRDTETIHYCENIQRGKQYACGSEEMAKEKGVKNRKRATKFIEINGKKSWYCGTEKSGCYKSAKGAAEKAEQKNQVLDNVNTSAPKKSEVEIKSKVLDNSRRVKLRCKKMILNGKNIYFDPELLYVANEVTKQVYGKLSLDKKTIEDLTEDINFLDKNDIPFEEKKKNSGSEEKSASSSTESEESKSSSSLSDEENSSNSDSDSNDSDSSNDAE